MRLDDRSCMSREVHVQFLESLGVRFPWATQLVILVDGFYKWKWLLKATYKRLTQELEKLDVKLNSQKTKWSIS